MTRKKNITMVQKNFVESSGFTVRDGKIFDKEGACLGDYSDRDATIYANMMVGHDYDSAAAIADRGIPEKDLWRYELLAGYRKPCGRKFEMTYKELFERLKNLTPTQLEQDVTVYLSDLDEYHLAWQVGVADEEQSVLDEDHIFLTV